LTGAVEVSTEQGSELLAAGKVLVLDSDVAHSVIAKDYSVLLLTIAWP
jgi:quercetin dioxygenase-like cupin family protein